jgi:hypothetical protein
MTWLRTLLPLLLALLVLSSSAADGALPVAFIDLATPFERIALDTEGRPGADRVAAVRQALDRLMPGVYATDDKADRSIARALADFPKRREGYDRAVRAFPGTLDGAVAQFRTVFPDFVPPLPIFLYHSLGVRDGGSDYLEPGHRHVMLFGADMIARLHDDDSLGPFMDHELFHLEHAHAFPDCDQFWCVLWQEGLAVDATAAMNPAATDHQLLLDWPAAIRAPTDAHWVLALCFVAAHFDDTADAALAQAFQGGGEPPRGLPDRFGYYVGYRVAGETGQAIVQLDRLDHEAARTLLQATLVRMMAKAKADCAPPAAKAAITQAAPRPV